MRVLCPRNTPIEITEPASDHDALDDLRAGADEAVVLDDGRASACSGSSTPPMPTPPDRCTLRPICAHEPTVAQVSTIVPEPTQAPMLT